MRTLEERFWAKVRKGPGCWEWTAGGSMGYGYIKVGTARRRAHRVSWELAHGPIPEGLWVLHHCDTPLCVRPDHLWLGTAADNAQDRENKGRGNTFIGPWNAAKTHCPRGHEYNSDNTRVYQGRRWCRACDRARASRKVGV